MPSIDINLHHVMREAAGAASSENGMGGRSGAADYLSTVINRLDNTLKKLDASINSKINQDNSLQKGMTGGGGGALASMGKTIAEALATAVGVTLGRYLNNQANAIMSRATNVGSFGAAAISGNANQQFGQYASRFVTIEAQRRIANVMATGEGAGGGIGAAIGTAIGAAVGTLTDVVDGPLGTIGGAYLGNKLGGKIGAVFGGGAGAVGGKLAAAAHDAQYIQAQSLAEAALVQRNADASVAQWKTGFARFGLGMTNTQIVGSDITGGSAITAPLQAEFMKKYGGSQNFNAIQNQIAPYLTTGVMSGKTGDLGQISQQFLKAGFAVSDFSKLTMQGSQYMAISGKTFKDFSNDLVDARSKFGDAYDLQANQNALNLMQLGIGKDQAQHLANQAMYNPAVMSGLGIMAHSTFSDTIMRQAGSKILGYDANRSLLAGHMVDSQGNPVSKKVHDLYARELQTYMTTGVMGQNLMMAGAFKQDPALVAGLLQGQVGETKLSSKLKKSLEAANLGPGQQEFATGGGMQALLNNVSSMMVNAGSVTLINGGGATTNSIMGGINSGMQKLGNIMMGAPSAHGSGSYIPTKR